MVLTNGMMVPNFSTAEQYDRQYALGNTQYGQMTAGSYCYIGPQGIVHGTTITLLNAGRKYLDTEELASTVYVSSGLGGNQLGMTQTHWTQRDGLRVISLTLVTRSPGNPERRLPAAQVGLTAAHEMGHALGLPHSNNRRDVMYPTNSANRLTAADFETLRGLYALPNGAVVDLSDVRGN